MVQTALDPQSADDAESLAYGRAARFCSLRPGELLIAIDPDTALSALYLAEISFQTLFEGIIGWGCSRRFEARSACAQG